MLKDPLSRGARKCGTCLLYTDREAVWKRDCDQGEGCHCPDKSFEDKRRCPDFKRRTFIDPFDVLGLNGSPTGVCTWKCPPILERALGHQWNNRYVNRDTSWCHCWTPAQEYQPLEPKDDKPDGVVK